MKMKWIKFIFISVIVFYSCGNDQKRDQIADTQPGNLVYHWNDDFKDTVKIKKWLNEVFSATQNTLGEFPFDVHMYIAQSDRGGEPVPWAHTDRNDTQSVYFFIDTSYSLEEFLNDWTAPHEISHLTIPFLGKKYSWFAEGYATCMQCQILHEMGQMTGKQVEDKYKSKIKKVKNNFLCSSPYVLVVDSLLKKHNYPAMYWGSVNYFIQADSLLKVSGKEGLNSLIQKYQKCCRKKDSSIEELMFSLDSLAGNNIFSDLLNSYINKPAKTLFQ